MLTLEFMKNNSKTIFTIWLLFSFRFFINKNWFITTDLNSVVYILYYIVISFCLVLFVEFLDINLKNIFSWFLAFFVLAFLFAIEPPTYFFYPQFVQYILLLLSIIIMLLLFSNKHKWLIIILSILGIALDYKFAINYMVVIIITTYFMKIKKGNGEDASIKGNPYFLILALQIMLFFIGVNLYLYRMRAFLTFFIPFKTLLSPDLFFVFLLYVIFIVFWIMTTLKNNNPLYKKQIILILFSPVIVLGLAFLLGFSFPDFIISIKISILSQFWFVLFFLFTSSQVIIDNAVKIKSFFFKK